jgi:hypothetical protein
MSPLLLPSGMAPRKGKEFFFTFGVLKLALVKTIGEHYPAFLKGDSQKVKEFLFDRITLNSNLSLIVPGGASGVGHQGPRSEAVPGLGRPISGLNLANSMC